MEERPTPAAFLCLAADPSRKGRLYGGTFNEGLWISNDSGKTWEAAGQGISHNSVMSVAVSPTEVKNGYHVVWAGTEPSGLFRSEDGGETWVDCPALLDLPSKSSWSFRPVHTRIMCDGLNRIDMKRTAYLSVLNLVV